MVLYTHSTLLRIVSMPDFLIPIIIGGIIQVLKIGIDLTNKRKITFSSIRGAGGFPSVHSGIAASVTTLMYLHYGAFSGEFAICICFSFLFRYDAVNIRYEAGQHATFLNKINEELDKSLNLGGQITFLKERLGHTGFEVIGGIIVGSSLTLLYYFLILPGISL